MKYRDEDFKSVVSGKRSLDDIASSYGVSKTTLLRAMNRRGYYLKKNMIKITTPYECVIVSSVQECANSLNLGATTIKQALKGKRIKVLDELEIKLEKIKYD